MTDISKEQVLRSLEIVTLADGKPLAFSGLVSDIFIADGKIYFSLSVPAERVEAFEPVRLAAQKAVEALPGARQALVTLTADKQAAEPPKRAAPEQKPEMPRGNAGGQRPAKPEIPGIGSIIAVASGKGGVGKSTTSVNLALGLAAEGLRVGLLDADIYGPSIPRLMGLSGRPMQGPGRTIMPMEKYGLKVMSIGFLVDEGTAVIWRGPMVQSALMQMLREVAWGELDVLVVDMPPGTGDAQLTMAQQVPLAGSVVVSTPQDLALIDARKAIAMFNKVSVPVLGIVENMSAFVCPNCGETHHIFGHGGAKAEAEKIGVPFLGEVPLAMDIRTTSDAGTPVVAGEPDGVHATAYRAIAAATKAGLATKTSKGPSIVFD
ncbi:Mrp/NBP35 family ATP-binding protein [Martelella radicis]|uniref:Iron-sulfur cluster carrier protein n=1 Tax=Martelella radicis TaxID=1397476 RepID=A0A7W6P989_9HYPH|nr:Mrp/NBP35 family ATP-binding protein [Martelella radicis]MBB4122017.1 ATP-binding protein involved in chromosome partitioning [Martelella radicis]